MSNSFFRFKEFIIHQDQSAMKVTTDACLFGAWAAKEISGLPSVQNILDIGTGTGLLSLMLAQKTSATIDAIELDPLAADQAAKNIASSTWKDRINIIEGNAKTMDTSLAGKYDILISNPPFYENELNSPDSKKNIAHHDEGLLLTELFELIKRNLLEHGLFYLLLPYKRFPEFLDLIKQNQFSFNKMALVKQTPKHDYFRFFISGSKKKQIENYASEEIIIRNEQKEYTVAFIDLLKDYYLYL